MEPRMDHPVMALPGAMKALTALSTAAKSAGVPAEVLEMVHLRASQVNGCSVCVHMHARDLKKAGESDERVAAVAAWRDAPWFSDAERAALALAEAVTRLDDRADPVPDAVWDEAARHYDQQGLAALVVSIAAVNAWNRVNVATRQVAGTY
ncbi:MAG TPA: carboxymuconolactone decarboxylase family protein [Acidimicrobiales bacterium]